MIKKNHIEGILGEDSDLEVNEIKERLVEKGYMLAYSTLCRNLNKIQPYFCNFWKFSKVSLFR